MLNKKCIKVDVEMARRHANSMGSLLCKAGKRKFKIFYREKGESSIKEYTATLSKKDRPKSLSVKKFTLIGGGEIRRIFDDRRGDCWVFSLQKGGPTYRVIAVEF
jgi:hypothetical protein